MHDRQFEILKDLAKGRRRFKSGDEEGWRLERELVDAGLADFVNAREPCPENAEEELRITLKGREAAREEKRIRHEESWLWQTLAFCAPLVRGLIILFIGCATVQIQGCFRAWIETLYPDSSEHEVVQEHRKRDRGDEPETLPGEPKDSVENLPSQADPPSAPRHVLDAALDECEGE